MDLEYLHQHGFPFTVAFSGFSGSGKTTLIAKLVERLQHQFKIGYLKTDAHHFDMDKEGKDTHTIKKAGATQIFIRDKKRLAWIGDKSNEENFPAQLLQSDFLLVEGFKNSKLPKIVFLDEKGEMRKKLVNDEIDLPIAYIGTKKKESGLSPYFHRDEVEKIQTFLLSYLKKLASFADPIGIVLAGGKSQRMGRNKALIQYKDKPQYQVCYDLLQPYCSDVYISLRGEGSQKFDPQYPVLQDRVLNCGPSGAILSTMMQFPSSPLIIIACDLPFLTDKTLKELLNNRDPFKNATYFLNNCGLPEPLCTIYEPKARFRFFDSYAQGVYKLRSILQSEHCREIPFQNGKPLTNVNHPQEYLKAAQEIQSLQKIAKAEHR